MLSYDIGEKELIKNADELLSGCDFMETSYAEPLIEYIKDLSEYFAKEMCAAVSKEYPENRQNMIMGIVQNEKKDQRRGASGPDGWDYSSPTSSWSFAASLRPLKRRVSSKRRMTSSPASSV